MTCILIISPEPWDGRFVSKHHYAYELALRGNDVVFYGPPEVNAKFTYEDVENPNGRIRILHAPKAAPGLRMIPPFIRRLIERNWLGKVEKALDVEIDVIWNFENSRFFDMGFAGERLKIYQQVDLNQDFNPSKAAATADLAIAISDPIEKRIKPFARNFFRLTHGYAKGESGIRLDDEIMQGFSTASVNAMLVGNLNIKYLDIELIVKLIFGNPSVFFHFVGDYLPGQGLHRALASASNVRFWGLQDARLIPSFLELSDILLVCYLADSHLEQLANPHKIIEYLASGKCVLATRTLEYEKYPELLEMAFSHKDFLFRFEDIVSNIGFYNNSMKCQQRKDFALDNTYALQVDRIKLVLGALGDLI